MNRKILLPVILLPLLTITAHADSGVGAGAIGGTTGVGIELSYVLQDHVLALRIPVTSHTFNDTVNSDGTNYHVDFNVAYGGVLLDWHPFSNCFRFTAGLYNNQTDIKGQARPTTNVNVGNNIYTPAQAGTLTITADYKRSLAPYLGFGFGNTAEKSSGLLWTIDIGAAITGDINAKVSSSGTVTAADLAAEAQQINNDTTAVAYPVIDFGIGYRF